MICYKYVLIHHHVAYFVLSVLEWECASTNGNVWWAGPDPPPYMCCSVGYLLRCARGISLRSEQWTRIQVEKT